MVNLIVGPALGSMLQRVGGAAAPSTLLDDLVAYWKLDEPSDGSAQVDRADSVGSNTLTDVNTTASVAGKISLAADFVRADATELSIVDNADLSLGALLLFLGFVLDTVTHPSASINPARYAFSVSVILLSFFIAYLKTKPADLELLSMSRRHSKPTGKRDYSINRKQPLELHRLDDVIISQISKMQFYLHQLAGSRIDRSWDKVADLLKIDE